jgi:hypothetical protein
MIDLPPMYQHVSPAYYEHALYPHAFNDESLTMDEKMVWFFWKHYGEHSEILDIFIFSKHEDSIYKIFHSLRKKGYVSEQDFRDLFQNDPQD